MRKTLAAAVVLAALSSSAMAAQPMTETDMDKVTAGVTVTPLLLVTINGNLNSTTGLDANFSTQQTYVVSPD